MDNVKSTAARRWERIMFMCAAAVLLTALTSCVTQPPFAIDQETDLRSVAGERIEVYGTVVRTKGFCGVRNGHGEFSIHPDLLEGLDGAKVKVVGTLAVSPVDGEFVIQEDSPREFSPIGASQGALHSLESGGEWPIVLSLRDVKSITQIPVQPLLGCSH